MVRQSRGPDRHRDRREERRLAGYRGSGDRELWNCRGHLAEVWEGHTQKGQDTTGHAPTPEPRGAPREAALLGSKGLSEVGSQAGERWRVGSDTHLAPMWLGPGGPLSPAMSGELAEFSETAVCVCVCEFVSPLCRPGPGREGGQGGVRAKLPFKLGVTTLLPVASACLMAQSVPSGSSIP